MSKEIDPSAKRNLLIVVGVIASAVVLSVVVMSGDAPPPPSSQSYIPQGGAAVMESDGAKPEGYDKLARQEEEERAKNAALNGQSYLPTLTVPVSANSNNYGASGSRNGDGLIDQKIASEQPAPPTKTPDQIRLEAQSNETRQQAIFSRKMAAWAALNETLRYEPSVRGQEVLPSAAARPSQPPTGQPPVASAPTQILMQAGDSLYASIDMSVNTDEPSVVFATVLSGKLKNSMLFGAARLNPNETITIEFDKISMPGKAQAAFRGVVIDSGTGRAALSGTVNRKIFTRYIMPIAASVAKTYGDLLAKQGQTSTIVAGGAVTSSTMTNQQISDAALASGITSVTGAIAENAQNSSASVELPNKLSVEVKLMQDVVIH